MDTLVHPQTAPQHAVYNATWEPLVPAPAAELWFDLASSCSYLSMMRIEAAAVQLGVQVAWKPFLPGPIFQSLSWTSSSFVLQRAKGHCVWQDMVREYAKHDLLWTQPSTFPRASVLPLRVAPHGVDTPWIDVFCQCIMLRNFAQDRDIHTPDAVAEELTVLGLPADAIPAQTQSDASKLDLREQTHPAQICGIFGVPTSFVGDAMFWGNDHLDDALACAVTLQSGPGSCHSGQPIPTQTEKARAFRAPHERSGIFVIPNPWDPGSARPFVLVGFEALTSTSAGFAFSHGLPDYGAGCDIILAHVADLVAATDVPMAADLVNGSGDAPEVVVETIRPAGATGTVGDSIEDATGRADAPIYSLEASVDCVRAVVEAARVLLFPFMLTACSEDHLHGRNDLVDTVCRLWVFQDAGVDVLYTPGLKARDEIAVVPREIDRPLNVLTGFADGNLSMAELTELSAKRISVGATLACAAMGAFVRAAEELCTTGTFSSVRDATNGTKLNGLPAPFA